MAVTEAQVRAYLEPEEPGYPAAAAALGADALPVLERLVTDADPLLASKAAYLASLIPDEGSGRVLERAARSEHPTVRIAAAAGLPKHPEVSDDAVAELLGDRDEGVRKVARKSLRGRVTPGLRNRLGARAATEQDPARRAAFTSALDDAGMTREPEDHGGGPYPDRGTDAERSLGEGGGDETDAGSSVARPSDPETDGGGGGDLRTGATSHGDGDSDGPDGGGVIETESAGDGGTSAHGGGRI